MNMTQDQINDLQQRIATEPTQLTFYQCENRGCSHYKVPKQIREFTATNQACYPPAIHCDGVDGCGEDWARMKDTTLSEA